MNFFLPSSVNSQLLLMSFFHTISLALSFVVVLLFSAVVNGSVHCFPTATGHFTCVFRSTGTFHFIEFCFVCVSVRAWFYADATFRPVTLVVDVKCKCAHACLVFEGVIPIHCVTVCVCHSLSRDIC